MAANPSLANERTASGVFAYCQVKRVSKRRPELTPQLLCPYPESN